MREKGNDAFCGKKAKCNDRSSKRIVTIHKDLLC